MWGSGPCFVCDPSLSCQALGWRTLWERCPFMWRFSLIPTLESTRLQSKVGGGGEYLGFFLESSQASQRV